MSEPHRIYGWQHGHLSIVRHYGGAIINGKTYVIRYDIDGQPLEEVGTKVLRRQHAEIERLKAVALQAQNAAIDLANKIPRLSADDAAQVIGMMNERAVRMTECRDPSEACSYPQCMVDGGRCNLLMSGLCSGPRAADSQQVPR